MAGDWLGRSVRPRGTGACRRAEGARASRSRCLPGQSQRPPFRPHRLPAVPAAITAHAQRLQRIVGGPVAAPVRQRADVRSPVPVADSRHRSHGLHADDGRQSSRLQRQLDDGAGHSAPNQGADCTRQAGRDRSAPHRNRRTRQRTPFHPPRMRWLVPRGVPAGTDAPGPGANCALRRKTGRFGRSDDGHRQRG